MYGNGGFVVFWNGGGKGGWGFGYLFCRGINIGGNIGRIRI